MCLIPIIGEQRGLNLFWYAKKDWMNHQKDAELTQIKRRLGKVSYYQTLFLSGYGGYFAYFYRFRQTPAEEMTTKLETEAENIARLLYKALEEQTLEEVWLN